MWRVPGRFKVHPKNFGFSRPFLEVKSDLDCKKVLVKTSGVTRPCWKCYTKPMFDAWFLRYVRPSRKKSLLIYLYYIYKIIFSWNSYVENVHHWNGLEDKNNYQKLYSKSISWRFKCNICKQKTHFHFLKSIWKGLPNYSIKIGKWFINFMYAVVYEIGLP